MMHKVPPEARLTDLIVELLQKHGYPEPTQWLQALHPDALTIPDQNVQRFLINRYWRQLLGTFPTNTMDARYHLVDTGDLSDWLRLFELGVIPCLLQHTPPKNNS